MIGVCQTITVRIGWISAMILIRRLLAPNLTRWLLGSMVFLLFSLGGRWLVAA